MRDVMKDKGIHSAPKIKHLDRNNRGRDFVIGDIHGAFDLVLRGMEKAKFDPAADRLISVGDLIDRGSGSHRCVKFLAQPYVHAVRGNHEEMLIDLYEDGEPAPEILRFKAQSNGFAWWLSMSDSQRQDILTAVRGLPYVLEVETIRGTVGLLHADVPRGMSWVEFLDAIAAGDQAVLKTCLWGRNRVQSGDSSGVKGIGRVYVGHTPQKGPKQLGNVFYIDTAAVFGELRGAEEGGLTMARIEARTEAFAASRNPYSLVDLRGASTTPSSPFGSSMKP